MILVMLGLGAGSSQLVRNLDLAVRMCARVLTTPIDLSHGMIIRLGVI